MKRWLIIGLILLVLLVGIFLLFRFARQGDTTADTEWLTSTLIAHRGMHNATENIPENSLSCLC